MGNKIVSDSPKGFGNRYWALIDEIAHTAKWAGRTENDVCLIAVSKRQTDEKITTALEAGHRVFGENQVKEAEAHWQGRRTDWSDLELRLIGHLQSNKSREAVSLFDIIETLDREKLAKTLADAVQRIGRSPEFLVQVNTGEEAQKGGIIPSQLDNFLTKLDKVYQLKCTGLMCIPPKDDPPAMHFALLNKLAKRYDLPYLSMGMSQDWKIAVKLGATHIRIGTGLFGPREF